MDASNLTSADAESLLVRLIAEDTHGGYGTYGYDVYLPSLAMTYLKKELGPAGYPGDHPLIRSLMKKFYPAAWDLCRRGILRPGPSEYGGQVVNEGQGAGYSITPFGEQWLAAANRNDFLPTEPERYGQMLSKYQTRFSPTFQIRGQEAVRCYGALAYIACCAMCGAAAETILLSLAVEKLGEETASREYRGATGRSKIQNALFGKSPLRDEAQAYLTLLNYWRTDATHGKPTAVGENEAFTALTLLLRFAIFASDNWAGLTKSE